MNKVFTMYMALLPLLSFLYADDFLLIKDNKAEAVIVHPGKNYAGVLNEFNAELKRAAGATIPVVDKKEPGHGSAVKFQIREDATLQNEDSFSIEFPDNETMLINCSPLSLQWSLNYILENHAGIKFLFNAKCGRSYNAPEVIAVPRRTVKFSPSFTLGRSMYLSTPLTRPWFYMKDGAPCNHHQSKHAFPEEKYLKDNSYPQVIRPIINGKKLEKIPHNPPHAPVIYWQPCYSHPETARIASENILQYLEKNPKINSISLTVNDNGGFCECLECEKANGGKKGFNQSEVYFIWVNRVAEQVCAKHPDLIITASAYAHTYNPPSFKLHKNVLVLLTIDLYSATDSEMKERHKRIIDEWGKKASTLGVWDYCWGYPYIAPRVYTQVHAEMLRYLHARGCRFYFGENECYDAKEGPKVYLIHRLLLDIDADVDRLLADWYEAAVGIKAAPYLKKYYDFWEDYFQSEELRQTPWFGSKGSTYMTQGDDSHIYGLKPGDLAKARSYMEKALALAETAAEKERAEYLMRHFEYAEARLMIHNAENIAPDSKLHSALEAVKTLQSIANVAPYLEKKKEIVEEMKKEPWLNTYYENKYFRRAVRLDDDGSAALLSQVVLASDFIEDPAVRAEMAKLSSNSELPPMISSVTRAFCNPDALTNLFSNGSVESEQLAPNFEIHPEHRRAGNGVRSDERKYSGAHSFKVIPGAYTLVFLQEKAQPDTSYLLSMKIFIPFSNAEAYMQYAAYPSRDGINQSWRNLPKIQVPAGSWQTYTAYCRTKNNSDGVKGYVFLKGFEKGEVAYIDDVRLWQVSE